MTTQLKAQTFNSIQELVNGLFASKLIFVIDNETKEDIYILNESKTRNQSEHYQVEKTKDNKFKLKEIKD
jgi:hypothetical protein